MPVLDYQDDLGALLLRAIGGNPSELVKTAASADVTSLKDRDYALLLVDRDGTTTHRKYACYDKGNIAVSMLYLEQAQPHLNRAAVKVAASNLSRLAEHWGMEVPEEIYKLANLELTEQDRSQILDERHVKYVPPAVAEMPKQATAWDMLTQVKEQWVDLPHRSKRAAALEIEKMAEVYPLAVPEHIQRYAGEKLGSRFGAHMRMRHQHVRDPELVEAYIGLEKAASVLEPEQVVRALEYLDSLAGFSFVGAEKYGSALADPSLTVYDHEKTAAYSWICGGESVNETQLLDFAQTPQARKKFLALFSTQVWEKFFEHPLETFKAMPQEQKVLVARLARRNE